MGFVFSPVIKDADVLPIIFKIFLSTPIDVCLQGFRHITQLLFIRPDNAVFFHNHQDWYLWLVPHLKIEQKEYSEKPQNDSERLVVISTLALNMIVIILHSALMSNNEENSSSAQKFIDTFKI